MTTTTLRLPEDLKTRVASAADSAGLTAHGFMLRAIEAQTAEAEEQAAFERLASKRWKQYLRSGKYHTHEAMVAYAGALARGESPPPPVPSVLSPEELARVRASARRSGKA